MFLYIDAEDVVRIKRSAMEIPEIKNLYAADRRNESKPFFNKALKYIFHTYSKELEKGISHPLVNLGLNERLKEVIRIYFEGEDITTIIENKKVKEVKDLFIYYSLTTTERYYESIKNNIETWMLHISNIPMMITKPISQKVYYSIGEGEEKEQKEIYVKTTIEIDNSDEMIKAMKNGNELIKIEEDVKKKVIRENAIKENNAEESMLDTEKLTLSNN
jgi:hypothetical protein